MLKHFKQGDRVITIRAHTEAGVYKRGAKGVYIKDITATYCIILWDNPVIPQQSWSPITEYMSANEYSVAIAENKLYYAMTADLELALLGEELVEHKKKEMEEHIDNTFQKQRYNKELRMWGKYFETPQLPPPEREVFSFTSEWLTATTANHRVITPIVPAYDAGGFLILDEEAPIVDHR